MKKNGEVNGDFSYSMFFNRVQTFAKLLDEYQIIKAMLLRLHFVVDNGYIVYLRSKGYRVLVNPASQYTPSLKACLSKCENILTKITMKQNEIYSESQQATKSTVSLEQLIAHISIGLGYEVKEDITLARFNEYKKIITAKTKKHNGSRNKSFRPL